MNVLQMNHTEQPSKLDVLEVLAKRSGYLNPHELAELNRLRAGVEGEQLVADYLEKYGKAHWTLVPNMWLDDFGTLECDGLLLMKSDLYVLEIKNYSGLYAYANGISTLNHRELSVNPIYQTRKAAMKVRELTHRRFPHLNVHGVLVFVGIDSQVVIPPEIDDIQIVQRHELRAFIEKLGALERTLTDPVMPTDKVLNYLKSYTTENPYPVEPLSPRVLSRLQKGILCIQCASPQVEVTKKFVKCRCGATELREKATVRTICEYGVLNFTDLLTVNSLLDFFGGHIGKTYLIKILSTHFEWHSRAREDFYKNYRRLFSEIASTFTF